MARKKISLIGGGQIGQILALLAAQKELGDVVILDIPQFEGPVKGKALDLMEMRPLEGVNVDIQGTSNYEDISDSDVVIITAGVPRKPGMSRDDLLEINLKIISDVATNVKKYAPSAFVIVVSNPLDAIVYAFYKVSGFAKNKVLGMAGALDSSRFKAFIAMETGLNPDDVSCMVLGGHGDEMVPLTRLATVSGVPVTELLDADQIAAIEKRTRMAGGEIVKLLGNGSAFFSPAKSAMSMAEAYLKDQKRIIPSAALCEGEYGISDLFLGVPCIIGSGGVEKIIEVKLTDDEKAALKVTAEHVAEVVKETGM